MTRFSWILLAATVGAATGCLATEAGRSDGESGAAGTSGHAGGGAAGTSGAAGVTVTGAAGMGPAGATGTGEAGQGGATGVAGSSGQAGATGVAGTNGAAGTSGKTDGGTAGSGTSGAAGSGAPDGGAAGSGAAGAKPDGGPVDVGGSTNTLPAPVDTWMEHWFEHVQLLQRIAYNDDVAVYFDPDVPRSAADWLLPYMTKVWRYTRQTYGEFKNATTDGRLYQISHQGKYSGGHPSTYFDSSHDFRNVSDCGPGPWTNMSYDIPTHEVSHVVEGSNNGVAGSPQFGLWGDSKWAEFYLYDVFVALDMTSDAQRVFSAFTNGTDSFPQAGTHWFRDWFYPLWRDHGHAQVMVRYFKLLSQHFPKNGNRYARNMNLGEFVHFMSGAAGADLRAQAATAFGATHPTDAEVAKAKADFPMITY
jgi:hypothetical protein